MFIQLLLKALKLNVKDSKLQTAMEPAHSPSASFSGSLDESIRKISTTMGNSSDFIIRNIPGSRLGLPNMAVCYIEGLIDLKLLNEMMEALLNIHWDDENAKDLGSFLESVLPAAKVDKLSTEDQITAAVLDGRAVILFEGKTEYVSAMINGKEERSITEPSTQTVIRGPKDGFTEDIATNISLIRRRLRTPDLRIDSRVIGRYTQTKVSTAYIHGIADPVVVKEVNSRLESIHTDSVLESGYIEEFIQDTTWTPFPTMHNSERPDAVSGALLEGQVAIVVDGTPFVLIAPVTFFKFLHSSEDYYQRYDISTFLRLIRIVSFFVSLLLPSLYIAISTFHQEMIPTTLLISLASQREGIPLPALVEALLMELTFEIIREAGIRMPRVIGPAISIVGALVIGQAAVEAGLVSGAMVIVVSFTAIANFAIPAFNMAAAIRIIRFVLMFLAGTLGLFGILAGVVPILVHLVSLNSFGVPYFTPLAPLKISNMKDLIIRLPWPFLKTRPKPGGISSRQKNKT